MLGFFWEKFDYEDGVIIKSTPTLLFRELQRAELLFVRTATTEKAAENSDFSEVIIPNARLHSLDVFRTANWATALRDLKYVPVLQRYFGVVLPEDPTMASRSS